VGNWEVGAAAIKKFGGNVAVTYKTLKYPTMNAVVLKARSRMTHRLIEKRDVIRGSIEELSAGRGVYFTIDQRVHSGDDISFLGLPAQATRLPARLATKFNCPLLPIEVVHVGGAHYEVVLDKLLYPDSTIADEQERAVSLMRKLYREIEGIVRRRPDEWFCWALRWNAEELARIKNDRSAAAERAKNLRD
jgi:KDO2-lipid IV(A) lauroyltransferase